MSFIRDYFRLILFSSGLLLGVQVPALVDQYAKRVDAQLNEALMLKAGFQQTADRYFNSDIHALIKHYENSPDVIFNDDAKNIQRIVERADLLEQEQLALSQSEIFRTFHVLTQANTPIMQETLAQYSYTIMINLNALLWGLTSGVLFALIFDALLSLLFIRRKPSQDSGI